MKYTIYLLLPLFIISCTNGSKLDYKYSDKEQVILCENENNALLNEMLYNFEEDIYQHNPTPTKTRVNAYGQYIYRGMTGSSLYSDIATPHALAIRDQLIAENILITNGTKSNLNYEHPAVQCIINNIEDHDIKTTINALMEVNSMDPAMFNSRLRNFGRQAEKNRYQASYIALDSYYQNLVGLTLEALANE